MLDFSFKYLVFNISCYFSEYDNLYHVKCVNESTTFCVIHDFTNKSDLFAYISKLLAFLDILV